MKKTAIILITLLLISSAAFATDSIKSKIDSNLLSYLELKVKPLPEGLQLEKRLEDSKGRIQVEIIKKGDRNTGSYPAEGGKSSLETQLAQLDAEIIKVRRNIVDCKITKSSLNTVASNPEVEYIRLPLRPHSEYQRTEGVVKSGASVWQPIAPYRAKKVKVCILDGGFKGYKNLLGKTLPANVTVKSFTSDNDIEAGSVHGAGCAEIVHAMAPDAELYLVNHGHSGDLGDALQWIAEQDIDVVSYSMGWFNVGPGNGKDFIIHMINKLVEKGVAFVTSSGNYGRCHWTGTFNDSDNDSFHNFENGSNMMEFNVPAYWAVNAYLQWNEWGTYNSADGGYSGTDQDFDLHLYAWLNGRWVKAPGGYRTQNGNDWPTESAGGVQATVSTKWAIKIEKKNAAKNVVFKLYAPNMTFANAVAAGSITSPGDGEKIYSVGAADWENDLLHTYSSQGPTVDGRVKPDISSYARVSTESYGAKGFYGTSAACPHVAGAVALIMSRTPYTGADALKIFNARATDKGDSGKDNQYGNGVMKLNK